MGKKGAGETSEQLGEALRVLANARRIDLLRLLREPRAASDVRLEPSEGRSDGDRRAMSTQAVRKHLELLREHGFVQAAPGHPGPGEAWVVNHARLYAVAEQMRALAALRPLVEAGSETMPLLPESHAAHTPTPRLVVVHGLREAQPFPLQGSTVLGRGKDCDVRLDYDPFVSTRHAAVSASKGGWVVEDLGSRNGTHCNWLALPPKGSSPLRHGDVVGVGRTLLLFWA